MDSVLVSDFLSRDAALGAGATFLTGAAFLADAAGVAFLAGALAGAAFFLDVATGFFSAVAFLVGAVAFFDAVFLVVADLSVAAAFLVADAVDFFSDTAGAAALAFQPIRFSLPTTAFLLIPRRLPISAGDNPLPVSAFNFFIVALSQPLLILQNPSYALLLHGKFITVPIRKARGKNMIYNTFFIFLIMAALFCAWRISVADMRRRIIPDAYLFPLMLIGILILAFYPKTWPVSFTDAAVGASFGYAMGAIVGAAFDYVMRRRDADAEIPIGFGDIKLLAVGGLWLGAGGLAWALVLACIFGGTWARVKKMRFIPFAPFFIAGAILTLIATAILL